MRVAPAVSRSQRQRLRQRVAVQCPASRRAAWLATMPLARSRLIGFLSGRWGSGSDVIRAAGITIGLLGHVVVLVAHAETDDTIRIIHARKADKTIAARYFAAFGH
jgi:hypothetical protein